MSDITNATYINESVFSVDGEVTHEFTLGRKLLLSQGTDGIFPVTVYTSWYHSSDDTTYVWIRQAVVTTNLVSVRRGPVDALSTAEHYHTSDEDGGYMSASLLTDNDMSEFFWAMEAIRTEVALETNCLQGLITSLSNRINELTEDALTSDILLG